MNIQNSKIEDLVNTLITSLSDGCFSGLETIVPEFEDILNLGTSQFSNDSEYRQILKEYFDYIYKSTDLDQISVERIHNIEIKELESTDSYDLSNITCDIELKDRTMSCELAGALYFHQKEELKIVHYLLTEKVEILDKSSL